MSYHSAMECLTCGGVVVQNPGPGARKKFCTPKCRTVDQIRKKTERRAAGKLPASDRSKTGRRNPAKRKRALELAGEGHNHAAVASKAGLAPDTVRAILREAKGPEVDEMGPAPHVVPPEALQALEDFGYFRQRYFGRVPTPWQIEAGVRLVGLLASPEKEFVVLNVGPGLGKTTLFVHDLLAWLACRDRSLRCLVGSRTYRQAVTYTGRLRRSFMRVSLAPVDSDDIARGLAVQPESTLAKDYGRFQPVGRADQWAANEFVLVQEDDAAVSEKEASFSAYGMDSGFLGGRYDVVVWDDLVDRRTLRTSEGRDQLVRLYEDEMETRVEPGGLLVLQGQRMAADDLYRHCLDMRAGDPVDLGDTVEDSRPAKYHHIVYRAHNEDLCRGIETHHKDAAAWPEGCLLDPKRLPWRELAAIRANREEKYAVLYQQEDVDPAKVLVPRVWVDGGKNPVSGEQHPGCWDLERGLAEVPAGLSAPLISIATVDPSPTKYWAIEWWGVDRTSERRFLLDLVRQPMDAPEFLDWNYDRAVFTGFMEEWQVRSVRLGAPITHWVVEANAAQRFLLQYDHVRTWQAKHKVAITAHQTQRNKTDADYGVQSIAPHYRYGRIRLPAYGETARRMVAPLVDEATRYPDSTTTDCVMAHWFLEWHLPRLYPKRVAPPAPAKRPSWLKERAGTR